MLSHYAFAQIQPSSPCHQHKTNRLRTKTVPLEERQAQRHTGTNLLGLGFFVATGFWGHVLGDLTQDGGRVAPNYRRHRNTPPVD